MCYAAVQMYTDGYGALRLHHKTVFMKNTKDVRACKDKRIHNDLEIDLEIVCQVLRCSDGVGACTRSENHTSGDEKKHSKFLASLHGCRLAGSGRELWLHSMASIALCDGSRRLDVLKQLQLISS